MSIDKLDPAAVDAGKVIVLHRIGMELLGAIDEYIALPCDSLKTAMRVTANRYRQRLLDNAPNSKRFAALITQTDLLFNETAPIYVNAGRRLCALLRREAGAEEGGESHAVAVLIYMRKCLEAEVDRLKLYPRMDPSRAKADVSLMLKIDSHGASGTEGQKVVHIIFSEGCPPGRGRSWLEKLFKDVTRLSKEAHRLVAERNKAPYSECPYPSLEVESPDYTADRFPGPSRENY